MNDPISATASAALARTLSPVELFLQADSIVKTVIVLLLLASAWGWTVIAEKLVRLGVLQSRAALRGREVQDRIVQFLQLPPASGSHAKLF